MTTTFDRYLLRRFFHVFFIGIFATYGLYIVIDAFSNIDGFQDRNQGQGTSVVLAKMAEYYLYQSVLFFDQIGPILAVISVMVVLALLQRHSEIHPILSAGVPTFRLVVPLIVGVVLVNAVLTFNQELLIPRIAHRLSAPRGMDDSDAQRVDPVRDFKSSIEITGRELFVGRRMLRHAVFVLPVPGVVHELTTVKAAEAYHRKRTSQHPAGWLLRGVSPRLEQIPLTANGKKILLPQANGDEIFVVTDVRVDQLNSPHTAYKFLSTPELMRRVRSPSFGLVSVRSLSLHLHERLTRPLLNIIVVLLTVPLIVRKEGTGLVANLATCTAVMALVFVVAQGFLYLGKASLVAPDVAAWAPIILSGSVSAWLSGLVQT